MKILFFGDIVGRLGRQAVKQNIEALVKKYQIDFVIANGENATHGKGLIEKHYNELIDAGVDCITLGNHYMSKDNILDYIDDATALIRPLNLSKRIGGLQFGHFGLRQRHVLLPRGRCVRSFLRCYQVQGVEYR